ncbi:MAG: DUF3667 domain-containing protein [Bacteroidia bacterium]|nr:DUF3667 domain-containing protein [Bacteroidia bacterium]
MSHSHLRKEPICLNCGAHVEFRFCPNCGQENTETRQSFWGLFAHFLEDLTHYEGKFWKSLLYLFFRPGFLTLEFLKGRRVSYLPPVRMYIFVSFVTFLLPHVLPFNELEEVSIPKPVPALAGNANSPADMELSAKLPSKKERKGNGELETYYSTEEGLVLKSIFRSQFQLDSVYKLRSNTPMEMTFSEYLTHKKAIHFQYQSPKDVEEKFWSSVGKNFPKSLFIYLPLFAAVLTLIHRKGPYYYFDHAIFTLHFFCFLLLGISIGMILDSIGSFVFSYSNHEGVSTETMAIYFSLSVLFLLYYFVAYAKTYEEKGWQAIKKSVLAFGINTFLFFSLFLGVLLISIYTLH